MKTLQERDCDSMNLVFSYGVEEDESLNKKGYKFLGAGKDGDGFEAHVFQKETHRKFAKRNGN